MDRSDPFAELADEAAAADLASRRTQTRWLRHQAAEEATMAGTLVDLAESGVVVAVRSRSGRTYRGPISSVGDDFVVVGDRTWIRLDAVVAVRTDPGRSPLGPAAGDRHTESAHWRSLRLGEALADLVGDRPEVVLVPVAVGGEPVKGELEAVGADVVTVVLDGDRRARCYVALDAIADAVVLG